MAGPNPPPDPNAPAPAAESADAKALREAQQTGIAMSKPDGSRVVVDPQTAHEAYLAGELGYRAGETYVVHDVQTGAPMRLDARAMGRYSAANPYTADPVLPAEAVRAEQQAQRGGVGGVARTAAEHALDALTLGGAAVAGRALGGEAYAQRRQLDDATNASSAAVGEGLGLAAGLLTGGTEAKAGLGVGGRAIRAVGSPLRAAVGAGELAGTGARVVGEGLGLARGGIAARALEGGARAGVELGALSGGTEVARQAIGGADYDAERVLVEALRGAGEGVALGGGLGAAGSALLAGGRRVASGAADLVTDARGAAEGAGLRALEAAGGDTLRVELARAEALRSTGATGKALSSLAEGTRLTEQGQRLADRILREQERDLGRALQDVSGPEALAWAEARAARAGGQLDALVRGIDEAGGPGALHKAGISGPLSTELGKLSRALEGSAATRAAGREAAGWVEAFNSGGNFAGGTLAGLRAERIGLDGLIDWAGATGQRPLQGFYREARAALSRAESGMARQWGRDVEAAYKSGLAEYSDFAQLRQLYQTGAAKGTVGGLSELKRMFAGGGPVAAAGSGLGAAAGGLVGGFPGAFAGRELGGLAGRVGDMALRGAVKERGSRVAAQALRDLGTSPAAQVATTAARGLLKLPAAAPAGLAGVDAAALAGARALAAPAAGAVRKAADGAVAYGRAAQRAAARAARLADPAAAAGFVSGVAERAREGEARQARTAEGAAAMRLTAHGAGLSPDALDGPLAVAAATRAELATRALTEPQHPPPTTPYASTLPPSASHTDKLEGRRLALQSPESLARLAATGTLTADQVETVAAVLPRALAGARARVEQALAAAPGPPTPARLVAASILLGRPAAPELQPRAMQAVQGVLAALRAKAGETGAPKGPGVGAGGRGGGKALGAARATASAVGLPGDGGP